MASVFPHKCRPWHEHSLDHSPKHRRCHLARGSTKQRTWASVTHITRQQGCPWKYGPVNLASTELSDQIRFLLPKRAASKEKGKGPKCSPTPAPYQGVKEEFSPFSCEQKNEENKCFLLTNSQLQ